MAKPGYILKNNVKNIAQFLIDYRRKKYMLNLEELERKLDVALDNEDAQSLTDWLLNLRKDNYINFLGTGCIEPMYDVKYNMSKQAVTGSGGCNPLYH